MLRVHKLDKSLTLLVKYTLTPLSAPCESLAQRPLCCQDKECKQELPFTSSRQCIGTMDTRLYSAECKDSGQWMTPNQCWQSENSVRANIVWTAQWQSVVTAVHEYILSVGRTEAWACRSPPVLQYPTGPGSLVSHQPSRWPSSCRSCKKRGGD